MAVRGPLVHAQFVMMAEIHLTLVALEVVDVGVRCHVLFHGCAALEALIAE